MPSELIGVYRPMGSYPRQPWAVASATLSSPAAPTPLSGRIEGCRSCQGVGCRFGSPGV